MKTFLIDLDGMNQDTFKELMGFVLVIGLNFRKLDQRVENRTGRTLFVEVNGKAEEVTLKEFLKKSGIGDPIVIGNANKAVLNGKSIGVFCSINSPGLESYYFDSKTGKKFAIVRNQ